MVPFAMVIREAGSSKLKHFRGVPAEDAHNIQTHLNSLGLLVSTPPVPTRTPPHGSRQPREAQTLHASGV